MALIKSKSHQKSLNDKNSDLNFELDRIMEERKELRIPVSLNLDFSSLNKKKSLTTTQTINVSLHGFCFKSQETLSVGDKIQFKLTFNEKTLHGNAKIIWVQKEFGPGLCYGAEIFEFGEGKLEYIDYIKTIEEFRMAGG